MLLNIAVIFLQTINLACLVKYYDAGGQSNVISEIILLKIILKGLISYDEV